MVGTVVHMSLLLMFSGGVTNYRYIAIYDEFISYRNTKFISQYIVISLSSMKLFIFHSILVLKQRLEGVYLSYLYPYKRSLYSCACIYIILILFPSKLIRILRNQLDFTENIRKKIYRNVLQYNEKVSQYIAIRFFHNV